MPSLITEAETRIIYNEIEYTSEYTQHVLEMLKYESEIVNDEYLNYVSNFNEDYENNEEDYEEDYDVIECIFNCQGSIRFLLEELSEILPYDIYNELEEGYKSSNKGHCTPEERYHNLCDFYTFLKWFDEQRML